MNSENSHFDLILMDIIMPHLDGVSATVCIREVRPHIPIIAMTSNIRTDDIEMYIRYGESSMKSLFRQFLTRIRYERRFTETLHKGGHASDSREALVGVQEEPLISQFSTNAASQRLCYTKSVASTSGIEHGSIIGGAVPER